MKRYWVSWYQPGEDHRPIGYPPNGQILGWWCSGETCEEPPRSTLCAVVSASSEKAVKKAVHLDWPEATDWRFCEEMNANYVPGDRFPLSPWMVERFGVV